jgi:tRNA nucleotidyltransferase (CCA-adding enzyme)
MISRSLINLCQAIGQVGGQALLVGGWVRDHLRGLPEKIDYDLEVYGVEAEPLRVLLARHGGLNVVGEAFRVFKLRLPTPGEETSAIIVDVSLPRRESRTGKGHRGFSVTGDPSMSFIEASSRRDFTINAIMFDPLTEEIIDPHNGRRDIEQRIIRAVDRETFVDDSLRVLRAMQFASRFDFRIDIETVELCRSIDLKDLPAERIWWEVEKWLLSNRPSIGLHEARSLGVVDALWPEIRALSDCPQDPDWHPEGDVFIHTGMVLDAARQLINDLPRPKQIAVMLGALCHDFGKPAATRIESGRVKASGHDEIGVPIADAFLERLNVNSFDGYDVRKQTLALVAHHLLPLRYYRNRDDASISGDGAFRRLALHVEMDLLYRVARADCLGRTGDPVPLAEEWFQERVRALGIEERAPEPLLMGRHAIDLGLKPGPEIGELTRAVYEMQLDGAVTSLDEAISEAKKLLKQP